MRDAKYGEPIYIKENVNISSNIEVFIGMTSKPNMNRGIKDLKSKDALAISKIFIHPLLSTKKQVL